ncbi:hypothetical protein QQF64_023470 [Cirrhinus molitorella]|uniref:Uncharacterized protein n=1 Tax=Cirrhinus molitorella TaxID=172907 RepID=A0ABR3L8R8_9TELE
MTACSTSAADRTGTGALGLPGLSCYILAALGSVLIRKSSIMPVLVQEKHADSRKSKCSRADHEARSPTVTAKNIEHLWVMADRRRRRRLGIRSTC